MVARTEGRSRRTIGIVAVVVVVAVIGVVAYLLLYHGNSGPGTGNGAGGSGYFFMALSMSQVRWIGRKLRSIRPAIPRFTKEGSVSVYKGGLGGDRRFDFELGEASTSRSASLR